MNDWLKNLLRNNLYTNHYQKSIENVYKKSNDEIINLYNVKFKEIINHAYAHSKFYNSYYKKNGVDINEIKSINDIYKLPIITSKIIKNEVNNIYCGNSIFKIKGLTSGTTGTPLTTYRSIKSINIENAFLRNYRENIGFQKKDRIISIRGYLNKNSLYHFNKESNKLFISSPNINNKTINLFYHLIKEFQPNAIEAFPSYLFKLFVELRNKDLKINIPKAFTSSEMLYEYQRENIEQYFNTSIYDWYGNVERTICLAQNNEKKYKPLPLYSINEFNNNEIITTALNNFSFPLIRYAVNDTIIVKSTDFEKNLIEPEIIKIEGRSGNTLQLKDGSLVGCIDHAFKGINHLNKAEIIQSKKDYSIKIKLTVSDSYNKNDELKLVENLQKMLGIDTSIDLEYSTELEDIETNKKFQLIKYI